MEDESKAKVETVARAVAMERRIMTRVYDMIWLGLRS